ncbi:phage fiber-tail adaptor protein [Streptomyces sp. NPDC001774]
MMFVKDPSDVLDYEWDWSQWLGEGEEITDSVVSAADGVSLDSFSHTATSVRAWLSDGDAGSTYKIVCQITTSQARVKQRTLQLRIEEQ